MAEIFTHTFYVSPNGSDKNLGTKEQPFATISRAKEVVIQSKQMRKGPVNVWIQGGTYYLNQPIVFEPDDSGTADGGVSYAAYPGEKVTISGGKKLNCNWYPYQGGIWQCELPEAREGKLNFTQLFVNGKRQIRARYPNYDPTDPKNFSGYTRAAGPLADDLPSPHAEPEDEMTFSSGAPRGVSFDPDTFSKKRWKKPDEAIIHIYQAMYWGNLQWQIKDIDWDDHILWFGHGGQQMGAKWHDDPCRVDKSSFFFIENVFEELDAPGEWYFDQEMGILYYLPPDDVDLDTAVVEIPILQRLVEFVGNQDNPVQHITLQGFRFAHTRSTFLETYEVPSLSDWSIHRGGTVYLQGAHHCTIKDCFFDAVGGNAVFMNEHNRGNLVTGCKFTESGDSAICFVGSLERTVGTQRNFPYECSAVNNLIHNCGVFGKQIAGVYISRAKRITAGHNEIYHMPRAGICIGDGTWGGHIIEYNSIHETCLETGDHGPFNAWGRDKYWCLGQSHLPYTTHRSHDAGLVKIDAMESVILRHNFFKETSGWGLDLDDGASNYEIYNNLCVGVSMKLREGAHRTIYNNIWVNGANSPCFHVGNEDNHDRYFRNITVMSVANMKPENDLNFSMGAAYGEIYTLIAPPAHTPWLEEIDFNCFYSDLGEFVARVSNRSKGKFAVVWGSKSNRREVRKYSLAKWQVLGFDQHSVFADPLFVDPEQGDYRVQPESPALKLGFINFDAREAGLSADFPKQWLDEEL
jgi:hypothetical protein